MDTSAVRLTPAHYETFRAGSQTYFNSTRFFPTAVRADVVALYAFVRVADNFVDAVPQDGDGFARYCRDYRAALQSGASDDPIIAAFVELSRRRGFDPAWAEAFLWSMGQDLIKTRYQTVEEMVAYIYGSAEVIGLFMATILDLPPTTHRAAQMLGRAMQIINFIRDVAEDEEFGRTYLPLGETVFPNLRLEVTASNPQEFQRFLRHQIERYRGWQAAAEEGFRSMPRRYVVPIRTASQMYAWTARQIERDPMVIYRRKVKPSKARILCCGFGNALGSLWR